MNGAVMSDFLIALAALDNQFHNKNKEFKSMQLCDNSGKLIEDLADFYLLV